MSLLNSLSAQSAQPQIGVQYFGGSYDLNLQSDRLSEYREGLLSMGVPLIKFGLSSDYHQSDSYQIPQQAGVDSLLKLARDVPAIQQTLSANFTHYFLWTYSFHDGWWVTRFNNTDEQNEYNEIKELVTHLLTTYNNSGKHFYLGHWEGDWHLLNREGDPANWWKHDQQPIPGAIDRMIRWLNIRQQAIEDALAETPHTNVWVWQYSELNSVYSSAMQGSGGGRVVDAVLPNVDVDYVSYSAYEILDQSPQTLGQVLDYIEGQLPTKAGLPAGKRVFIGEFGFPENGWYAANGGWRQYGDAGQEKFAREFLQTGLQWGSPFFFYWSYYGNKVGAGGENEGYWLLRPDGTRTQFCQSLEHYYLHANDYLSTQQPNQAAFTSWAINLLAKPVRHPTDTQPMPASDSLDLSALPASIPGSGYVPLQIGYEATDDANKTITVTLFNRWDYSQHYGQASAVVSPGSGTVEIVLPITGSPPVGNQYELKVDLWPEWGDFNELRVSQSRDVEVTAPQVNWIQASLWPGTLGDAGHYELDIDYAVDAAFEIHAHLFDPNNGYALLGSGQVNVSAGSGLATVVVNLATQPAEGAAYAWKIELIPAGLTWEDSLDIEWQWGIEVRHDSSDRDYDGMPDSWEDSHGLNTGRDDSRDDADGDSLINWLEWALGANPRQALSSEQPAVGAIQIGQQDYLSLSYRLSASPPAGLSYAVEFSTNMRDWQAAGQELSRSSNPDGSEQVQVRDLQPLGANQPRFVRLSVRD